MHIAKTPSDLRALERLGEEYLSAARRIETNPTDWLWNSTKKCSKQPKKKLMQGH